jgi:hypothetical protein
VVSCGGMAGLGFRAGVVAAAAAVLVVVVVDLDDRDGVAGGGGVARLHLAMLAVVEIVAGGLV